MADNGKDSPMAITLEANYAKKLGLPAYSSHQYALTIRTEVNDLSQIQQASSHLYRQLQEAVDRDIQQTGFLPTGREQPKFAPPAPAGGQPTGFSRRTTSDWACSPKQKALIERLMQDHGLGREVVEELARTRFQCSLPALNKMQASGLIDEMIGTYGSVKGRGRS
ncbi:hypothetical protein H5P28_10090 [Ruficoccus amylovorans]|uniref:Uncharacterized protein n=1 Tax=Ruficoccus amylovorans TaxID=1804625 RepID=A0A842HEZ0_9BACT|nr:hypothetical protein [Ruficoccus amylovorans]MBC2594608.1 hypothetical protein [Ruficoccus amylovorans]